VKDVTIVDIARKARVSTATVSRALNGLPGVSEQTYARVHKIASEMGYRRNDVAASLVKRQTNTLGLVVPALSNPYFSSLMVAIKKRTLSLGYKLLICNSNWDVERELKLMKSLLERRVEGILLYPCKPVSDGRYDSFDSPMLIFGNNDKDGFCRAYVNIDQYKTGQLAVSHLFNQGYARPAFLGGNAASISSCYREQSYRDILKQRDVNLPDSFICEGKYSIESGYERTIQLLEQPDVPDSFFCANDLIALGCMAAITEKGFRIGADIGVIGVDNVIYSALPQIELSTVAIPIETMGMNGVNVLLKLIEEENDKNDKTEHKKTESVRDSIVLLEPKLIPRLTTKHVQKTSSKKSNSFNNGG
jgi:LacI family transcriptional regulator